MSETTLLNNRYQLENRLGGGGMAVVYRARDLMLERTVAVKVLREDYSNDPASASAFDRKPRPPPISRTPASSPYTILGWMPASYSLSWNKCLVLT